MGPDEHGWELIRSRMAESCSDRIIRRRNIGHFQARFGARMQPRNYIGRNPGRNGARDVPARSTWNGIGRDKWSERFSCNRCCCGPGRPALRSSWQKSAPFVKPMLLSLGYTKGRKGTLFQKEAKGTKF